MSFRNRIWFLVCLVPVGSPAQVTPEPAPIVLIAYYSESGHTRRLGEAIADGAARIEGVRVIVRPVSEIDEATVRSAAAIIVGSPVYNAAVAPAVQQFINSWPFDGSMKNKLGAAFATGGGISAGEELVMTSILQSMLVFGMIVVGGDHWQASFGASAITEEPPFDNPRQEGQFREKAEALGKRVAELALKMNR